MKTSNILILIASFLVLVFFAYPELNGRRVSVSDYKENRQQTLEDLHADTYNFKRWVFDEPFHRIVIQDTLTGSYKITEARQLRLVQAEGYGIKTDAVAREIKGYDLQNGVLTINMNLQYFDYKKNPLVIYAPAFEDITLKNIKNMHIVNAHLDSLMVSAEASSLVLDSTSMVQRLGVLGSKRSKVSVNLPKLASAYYTLKNSQLTHIADYCDVLTISGDLQSQVQLGDPGIKKKAPGFGRITYNDQLGALILTGSKVDQIHGDVDKLHLNMDFAGFKALSAKINP